MNEQSIFLAALEITDTSQRDDYLNQACGEDPALRRQVDALFTAHERSGKFLHVPALQQMAAGGAVNGDSSGLTNAEYHASQAEIDPSFLEPSTAPGSIGRLRHYDIHEVIGRGGCGIVLTRISHRGMEKGCFLGHKLRTTTIYVAETKAAFDDRVYRGAAGISRACAAGGGGRL